MEKFILQGNEFVNREKSYKHMNQVFDFPQDFGNNLDALWDILSLDQSLEIQINDARQIPRNLGDYGLNILDVFGDLGQINNNKIEFIW
ncbi:MAG: barstar family protein [Bacillota bacterium]|nr:barstar family protein [Bacillota bacterium]